MNHAAHRILGAAAIAASLVLGGCGVGAGESASGVELTVTDDFGRVQLAREAAPKQQGSDTVMRLLQRNAKVETRYGGGFVQAIDGRRGLTGSGSQVDWFFYVNGVLADRGAASWKLREGERVWWDRHRWDVAQVGSVVGSFPEPMRTGHDGRYAGATLDCRAEAATCARATSQLEAAGVKVVAGGATAAVTTTRVVVGPWQRVRAAAPELRALESGAASTGVFATVGSDGTPAAQRADETLAPASRGAALIAALREGDASPVWVVTGADEQAVARGVEVGLTEAALRDHLAVLVLAGRDEPLALPVAGSEQP